MKDHDNDVQRRIDEAEVRWGAEAAALVERIKGLPDKDRIRAMRDYIKAEPARVCTKAVDQWAREHASTLWNMLDKDGRLNLD